jgi:hypothetical protein
VKPRSNIFRRARSFSVSITSFEARATDDRFSFSVSITSFEARATDDRFSLTVSIISFESCDAGKLASNLKCEVSEFAKYLKC